MAIKLDKTTARIISSPPTISRGDKISLKNRFQGHMRAGLGSSGAAGVMLVSLFNEYTKRGMTKEEIISTAWKIENETLGKTGIQDQYAAMYGGLNYLLVDHLGETVNVDRHPLPTKEISKYLSLYYIGGDRSSAEVQKYLGRSKKSFQALLEAKKITQKAEIMLCQGDFEEMGWLLNEMWKTKKKSNLKMTNPRIDTIYYTAMMLGAWGGKVLGAGAGGYMIFLSPPKIRKRIERDLERMGTERVKFKIDFQGTVIK